MVTNFEFHTKDISIEDLKNVDPLIDILSKPNKETKFLTPKLVVLLNVYNDDDRPKVNGRKIRKLVNYIRTKGISPIIATSGGYYISKDPKEIKKQIVSLIERASSINSCADGLLKYLVDNKL